MSIVDNITYEWYTSDKGGDKMKNKKLRKMLIDANINFRVLAEKTGVTYMQVSRIVNGHSNGSTKWWRKAAEVLGCDITEIIE